MGPRGLQSITLLMNVSEIRTGTIEEMNADSTRRRIFITGATGDMGRELIPLLLQRGHEVRALVRTGSERKLPAGCEAVLGDALDPTTYAAKVQGSDTFVQLVGVAHLNPAKAAQFCGADLMAGRAAISLAVESDVQHFVYVSVAQPAPVMQEYIAVRADAARQWPECHDSSPLVCPWARPSLALLASAGILVLRAPTPNQSGRAAAWPGYSASDGHCPAGSDRQPLPRNPHPRCARDPRHRPFGAAFGQLPNLETCPLEFSVHQGNRELRKLMHG